MKIVVLDGHTLAPGGTGWEPLRQFGEVEVHPRVAESQVARMSAGADVLITNKANLPASTIAALPSLRFIAVSATGFNCVDTDAARTRNIPVSNVPEYGSDSVAQFTIALLLELCHRVGLHADAVRAGEWAASADFCFWKTPQVELAGKTLGMLGFGRIAKRVAELAIALRMRVAIHTPSRKQFEPNAGPTWVELAPLLATSDVVSLHCPLTPQTQGLINSERLASMKASAFLINTSRGGLVSEADLADALERGIIAGAAVDVISREPAADDNPLIGARNCIVTPHIAWTTTEARARLLKSTIANVAQFLVGSPTNVVN